MKYQFILVILIFGLVSCNEVEQDTDMAIAMPDEELYENLDIDLKMPSSLPENVIVNTGYASSPIQNQKLIKTAYLTLQVDDIESSNEEFRKLILRYDGHITQDNFRSFPDSKSRNMTVRVPSDQLEILLNEMADKGKYVRNRSINVDDVGEEFVDIEIRLKNKKAVQDQYLKLLERAVKVEDILKIENELRVIREEIEAKEGRLRYLEDQVSLSTIHLDLYQEVILAEAPPVKSFFVRAWENVRAGWTMIVNICLFIIRLWPLMLIAGVFIIVIRKVRKKYESVIHNT